MRCLLLFVGGRYFDGRCPPTFYVFSTDMKLLAKGRFSIRAGAILLVRCGPINHRTQQHFYKKPPLTDETRLMGTNLPPVGRGMWAFPFGYHDAFFYYHVWEARLPKRLNPKLIVKIEDDAARESLWAEHEEKMKIIRKKIPLHQFWWSKGFWTRFNNKTTSVNGWYWWDSPRDWARVAKRELVKFDRYKDQIITYNYAVDHLELFLPGKD